MSSKSKTEAKPPTVEAVAQSAVAQSKQQLLATVAAPLVPVVPATSEAALEQNLAAWGGGGGRLFGFNGSTGIHRTLLDNVEVPAGTEMIAHLHETQKGFIKFNPDGPPDVRMARIDQVGGAPTRDELGDHDEAQWPLGFSNEPEDPWKPQFAVPMEWNDEGRELYVLVARGQVAMNSVEFLLGRWRRHPKRLQGMIPIIRIVNSSYWSKKYQRNQPKPEYPFVTWVTLTGAPPPPPVPLSVEMNDAIPDFSDE